MASAREEGFRIEKLTADNYHSWKFSMKMYLIGKDHWEIVSGTEKLEAEADADTKTKFKKRENSALAAICLGISTSLHVYVRSVSTPKGAWDELAKHFEDSTLSNKIHYRRKLYAARMDRGTNGYTC